MVARQNHGFIYESMVIDLYELNKASGYTNEYDAYTHDGIPVQIKCIKKGRSIDLGDIFRNSNKKSDFYLIIGFYTDIINGKPVIDEEYVLFFTKNQWNGLFIYDDYDSMRSLLNTISNDHSDDKLWKTETKKMINRWKKVNKYIVPAFKRDHKKQKRIQCRIQNKVFYEYFVKVYECQRIESQN